ncbi:MAG TPA: peptide-methionine (R)-S-oxide reductase MsrB [Chitinophagaceae bacterium]|nr:peptide-methionine (R)-S-oxide reductase MsrB [Chitinophagaceae bacterium]HMZ45613.1 peptide-methionine (R)-S-oxide reductase MsrB [Chitinophagaceae bacterium]HNF29977.1 peptide-methionine (R)-S-oxide reductase MsrB [Chitinophagaceae bacterium]HNN31781.1 peptide-methionine (R)-S-oxide reductase MsrB [Chitinophagaceae bacterium]
MNIKFYFYTILLVLSFTNCTAQNNNNNKSNMQKENKANPYYSNKDTNKLVLKEEEWRKILTSEQFYIARQKGTEQPFSSKFENFKEKGTYYCAACGNALFISDTKFESGCGWPSFYQPINKSSIIYTPDTTHGMQRTEVQCGRCKAHLGHVFNDGPPPSGLRYCINGVILDFKK